MEEKDEGSVSWKGNGRWCTGQKSALLNGELRGMQWTGLWSNTAHSLAGTFGARVEVPVRDGSQRGPRWGSPAMAILLPCANVLAGHGLGFGARSRYLSARGRHLDRRDYSQSIASWQPGRVSCHGLGLA